MRSLVLIFAFLAVQGTFAQVQPPPAQENAPSAVPAPTPATDRQALAYNDREFPSWVLKIRRAEIIAVGAFPLVYIFTGLGYDYSYYLGTGLPQENAPWPVGPGTSQWTVSNQADLIQKKNLTLVGVSLGISLLIAGADWFLGLQ